MAKDDDSIIANDKKRDFREILCISIYVKHSNPLTFPARVGKKQIFTFSPLVR